MIARILFFIAIVNQVSGEFAVQVLFNNGSNMTSASDFCDAADSAAIHSALYNVAVDFNDRRNLRERHLSNDCSVLCANWPPGMCDQAFTQCPGWRRLSEVDEAAPAAAQFERVVLANASCSAEMASVNEKLDILEDTVSAGCKNVLEAPRSVTCYIANSQ